MLKASLVVIIQLLCCGCVTSYENADDEPASHQLMGLRCEVMETTRLPRAEWHLIKIWGSVGSDSPAMAGVQKGTILRVAHFERYSNAFISGVNVQAEAQNGPQKGERFVIGEVAPGQSESLDGVILLYDTQERLSAKTGQLLRPLDAPEGPTGKMFHYPWTVPREQIPTFNH